MRWVIAWLLIVLPLQAEFVFVEGDPSALRCRVRKAVAAAADGATILTVEVVNGGAFAAEPLAFTMRLRSGDEMRVRRVPDPWHGRAGRAVPRGGKASYPLFVPAGRDAVRGAKVVADAASFHTGDAPDTGEPVRVVRRRTEKVHDPALGTYERTVVEIENRLDATVDAVFEASFLAPAKGPALLVKRLGPRERIAWSIEELPHGYPWERRGATVGATLARLDLADWSVLRDDGAAEAERVLREAYGGWTRWPDDAPAIAGRFAFEKEGADASRATGTFRLGAGSLEVDANPPSQRDAVHGTLRRLFADVRREALPGQLPCHLAMRDGDATRIGFPAAGLPLFGMQVWSVTVADGRIAGVTSGEHGEPRALWHTQPTPDGYLVTGRDWFDGMSRNGRPTRRERIVYDTVGGLPVPVEYEDRWEFAATGARMGVRVMLEDLRAGGAPPPTGAPAGDGANALRAAWDAPYRYPDAPAALEGRLTLKHPPHHAEWQGVREVDAAFRLAGFRAGTWSEFEVELPRDLAERQRGAVRSLLEGRLRIWARHEFAARAPFDEAFAGARITAADEPGAFDVAGGPFTRVSVAEGRVRSVTLPDGRERTYAWRRIGGEWLVETVRTGHEEIRVRHRRQGSLLLPALIEIEGRFGPGWGPETIALNWR